MLRCVWRLLVRLVGVLMLVFGAVIVVAAVALLRQPVQLGGFVMAGVALEGLGLSLLAREYALLSRRTNSRMRT